MKYFVDKENRKLMIGITFHVLVSFILSFYNRYLSYLVLIVMLVLIVYRYIKKRDNRVSELSQYLKRLNQGDYTYEIKAYTEGELSKLQTELNKTTIQMRSMNSNLIQQKDGLHKALEDISHQLKTPIASLLLLNELQTKDELVIKSKDQLNRLDYLVDSLLRLVKLDANLEDFEKESFHLKDLVLKSISMITPLNQDIEIHIEIDDLVCIGDFEKSKEALINVLHNKLRHAKSKINILSKSEHLSTVLLVFDDGDAIENKEKVFERFYSGDKRDSKSIGIGLPIAKELMERQNGTLTLKDHNTFIFRFNRI